MRGVVQGVGFRFATSRAAGVRSVSGWVRNRGDGSVEAVFEGDPAAVESMLRWCADGPRGAEVDEVVAFEEEPEGLQGFAIRG